MYKRQLAGCVGTANIAGVATAMVVGGPGAVFWMWVVALLGMLTKCVEVTLGQYYRVTVSYTHLIPSSQMIVVEPIR